MSAVGAHIKTCTYRPQSKPKVFKGIIFKKKNTDGSEPDPKVSETNKCV